MKQRTQKQVSDATVTVIMSFTKVVAKGLLGPIRLGLMLGFRFIFCIFSVYILLVVGI